MGGQAKRLQVPPNTIEAAEVVSVVGDEHVPMARRVRKLLRIVGSRLSGIRCAGDAVPELA